MSLGMNTRTEDTAQNATPESAEAWVREYITKLLPALDLPEKFYFTAHSWGGYFGMMLGSMYPERIESMFLMSPAGTHSYNEETYNAYTYCSL